MSDDNIILFPTDRIKNKQQTGTKNTKFQKQIEKEQTQKFVESAVDDIAMKLLHNFVDLAMKTNTDVFTRDFSYLVDVLRATIKRDFGLNHIVHKITDNTVELIHDNAGNTRARIDYSNINREFKAVGGRLGNTPIMVLSTGIGTDNIDIVLNELSLLINFDMTTREPLEYQKSIRLIRLGTS